MSAALVKETKGTSSASKADKKRSGKGKAAASSAAANPYANGGGDYDDDDDYGGDNNGGGGGSAGTFATLHGKELTFDAFVEELNDKHNRDEAVDVLFNHKLKAYNVTVVTGNAASSSSGTTTITVAMADALLGGIRAALGLGGGGRKGGKRGGASGSDGNVPNAEVAALRVRAVECGTALVLSCGAGDAEARRLFDTWGESLVATVTSIIKGLRGQMEDFIHEGNTKEGSGGATGGGGGASVLASPAGITSSVSAAQRRALSEISGKCYHLLVKCFDSLALMYALDPSMAVGTDNNGGGDGSTHQTVPAALLGLANLVIPDYSATATPPPAPNAFPIPGDDSSAANFYLPIEACGSLLKCLVSTCEPAQGTKARAVLLRLHRFVTGTTAVYSNPMCAGGGDDDFNNDNDDASSTATGDDDEHSNGGGAAAGEDGGELLEATHHKGTYVGLMHTLIAALAQSVGILCTRFPQMVASEESDNANLLSSLSSPNTATATSVVGPDGFTVTPLLSVEKHLVPLSKILIKKSMGKGKNRRETQQLLRSVAKKLGSLNGSNIDSLEEHETRRKKSKASLGGTTTKSCNATVNGLGATDLIPQRSTAASRMASPSVKNIGKFPTSGSSGGSGDGGGSLPEANPNAGNHHNDGDDAAEAEAFTSSLSGCVDGGDASAGGSSGADPTESIQFRDKISVSFVGFQQIFLAACLRSVTNEGLQKQLAQNPIIRDLFGIRGDLTRKVDRTERREQLIEAEAHKLEERRGRQKQRDAKSRNRDDFHDE